MTTGIAKVPRSCRYSHPRFSPNSVHLHSRFHHGSELLAPFPCSSADVPSSVLSFPSVIYTTTGNNNNERMTDARFYPLCRVFMHDPANELPRMCLPRTSVNRLASGTPRAEDKCVIQHTVLWDTDLPDDP